MMLDTLTDFSDIFNTDLFSSGSSSSSPSSRSASPKTPPNDSFQFLTNDSNDNEKPFDPMSMFTQSTDYLSSSFSPHSYTSSPSSSSSTFPLPASSSAVPPLDSTTTTSSSSMMDIDFLQQPLPTIDPSLAAFLAAFQQSTGGYGYTGASTAGTTVGVDASHQHQQPQQPISTAPPTALFSMPELALAMQQQQQQMMGMGMEGMTIDPQLVGTPSAATATEDEEDQGGDDAGDEDEDADVSASPSSAGSAPRVAKGRKSKSISGSSASTKGKKSDKGDKENEQQQQQQQEKLTLTIQPMKVAGHGKGGRKGTVASGGVVKKSSSASTKPQPSTTTTTSTTGGSSTQIKHVIPPVTNPGAAAVLASVQEELESADSPLGEGMGMEGQEMAPVNFKRGLPASAYYPTRLYPTKGEDESKMDDKDDDLPQDWRPPPEVFQKMSSKEKRQLRNKISARNFRVRRKEYISTLEYDIAERDRLLDVIRTELGSTQSENLALRQEIATLKKTLLDGRGASTLSSLSLNGLLGMDGAVGLGLSLPPPAPLPTRSAAEVLKLQAQAQAQASAAASISNEEAPTEITSPSLSPSSAHVQTTSAAAGALLTPNTQKDLSSSSSGAGSRFWGGLGTFGGVTPVHRMEVPEIALGGYQSPLLAAVKEQQQVVKEGRQERRALQENMNPMLNTIISNLGGSTAGVGATASTTTTKKPLAEAKNSNNVPQSWFAPSVFAPSPSPPAASPSPAQAHGGQGGMGQQQGGVLGGFDGYADMNPFTMKTMDAYRMHLWGKMAQQREAYAHQNLHQQHQPQFNQHTNGSGFAPPTNSGNTTPSNSGSPTLQAMSPFTFGYGQQQQAQQQQQGGYLANGLRPAFFSAPTTGSGGLGSLLAGKHSGSSLPPYSPPPPPYSSAPSSPSPLAPLLIAKGGSVERGERERAKERAREAEKERERTMEREREREKERQERQVHAAAQLASQTLFRKLGSAFWDAFAGSSSASSSSSSSSSISSNSTLTSGGSTTTSVTAISTNPTNFQGQRTWDADKVRKVLEGKAVVRVVDLEDLPHGGGSSSSSALASGSSSSSMGMQKETPVQQRQKEECEKVMSAKKCCTDLLEESMRGLSLAGKKA